MHHLLFGILILTCTLNPAWDSHQNRSSEQEIESVVYELFDLMCASDGEGMRSIITEEATLHTVRFDGENTSLNETSFERFIRSVSGAELGTLDEKLTLIRVHSDENLATAWMEYRFYVAGEFSHCGANTMNLIRKSEGWKIFSIVDTRRTEAC